MDNDKQRIHVKDKWLPRDMNDESNVLTRIRSDNEFTATDKVVDPKTLKEGLNATLSPQAVDTIYELYLQGWTVRDISKRFGIHPARTKFCVWVRAQLYH